MFWNLVGNDWILLCVGLVTERTYLFLFLYFLSFWASELFVVQYFPVRFQSFRYGVNG